MKSFGDLEMWFVTGSQQLYGEKILAQVAADSKTIAGALDGSPAIPVRVVYKPVLTTPEAIRALCLEANLSPSCIGLATWMHTFSPAKMWIAGLAALQKPFVHLHTQFNRDIPWDTIDMEFMNLNQSAHGDREFGFIGTRLRARRKVVVGHWQDPEVLARLGVWARAAAAWHDAQGARVARFGDNMREVAVTEGDKVEAQIRLGYDVYGYAAADLAARLEGVSPAEARKLLAEYDERYPMDKSLRQGGERRGELEQAARLEAGMRAFLEEGGFKAFTTNFEHLHGLPQLPGLAVQRLMAAGWGFGAEGDWKTAALVRALKVMGRGLAGGTSFMEDYTYHLDPRGMKVLGAHMLELCESIASGKPSLEIHPLFVGNKADPARLVFNVGAGPAVNASLIDLGNRFRLVVNEVEAVAVKEALPRLPVARAVWVPKPDLKTAAAAWILAGGAHHTAFSQAVGTEHLEDFARLAGVELALIDAGTTLRQFERELGWEEMHHLLARALR